MDTTLATPLLGGLTPERFMRRHWQKSPLLVRRAWPDGAPLLSRATLFALAARDDVESRLVVRRGDDWQLRPGPLARRSLPPLAQPGWTLLVQGVDLHLDAARALIDRFRFVGDARLDDVMVSYASDGGGVGPHVDSYDVFLLQVQGRRRWRVGRCRDASARPGLPLKVLARFDPEHDWLIEPGDMLYLPPGWSHDGVAEGNCMTASIGFRAPRRDAFARELMLRLADADDDIEPGPLYRDANEAATAAPARIAAAYGRYAEAAIARLLADAAARDRAIGELLSEPKPQVWFEPGGSASIDSGVRLDRRTRMLYDDRHVYINGESFRAAGRDARAMQRLADGRRLLADDVARLSDEARELVAAWVEAGWLHAAENP